MPDGPLRGGVVVIEARGLVVEQLPPLVVRRPFPVSKITVSNGLDQQQKGKKRRRREKETITENKVSRVRCETVGTKYLLASFPKKAITAKLKKK